MTTVTLARHAMATRFEAVLHGEDSAALRAAGEEALDEIERLGAQMSLYSPASEISRINARAADGPVRVEPGLFRLLLHAQKLWEESGGAFDITIAPLIRCWGFMGGTGCMPDKEQVAAARHITGMQLVKFDEQSFTVQFDRPGVMVDLGSIGKGYALEKAAEILLDAGVTSALLHGGTSTVHAVGAPPDADAWRIALEHPAATTDARASAIFNQSSAPDESLLSVVSLRDESLSVSAVWGKSFVADGKIFGHVIDPRAGMPVMGSLLAAVVLPSATETDALSTALLTLGESGLDKLAGPRSGMRAIVLTAGEKSEDSRILRRGLEPFHAPAKVSSTV